MKNKYHKFLIFFSYAILIHAKQSNATQFDVWSASPVGKCFNSINEYLILNFGDNYKNDENIKIINLYSLNSIKNKYAKQYAWTMDTTPSVNITRTLFKLKKNGKACAILHVPLSSFVSFELKADGELPTFVTSINSPPPDFSAYKIIYKLNNFNGTYAPNSCLKLSNKRKEVKIPCNRAFQE